jgi:hypothetical protein
MLADLVVECDVWQVVSVRHERDALKRVGLLIVVGGRRRVG